MTENAYLGIGLGIRPSDHPLIMQAMKALRVASFRCNNRQHGLDSSGVYQPELDGLLDLAPYMGDFGPQIESHMRKAAAIVVVLTLPPNNSGQTQLDESAQHRLMDMLEFEYALASILRDEISHALDDQMHRKGLAGNEFHERLDKDILFMAPGEHWRDRELRGYCHAVTERFDSFYKNASETRRPVNLFDTADAFFEKVCANIFDKFPNVAQATVMVSSTGKDLAKERTALRATISLLGHRSEVTKSRLSSVDYLDRPHTEESKRASLNLLRQCSMYMGIVRNRITKPVIKELSLTEYEYDIAYFSGRQCGFFVSDQQNSVAPEAIEIVGPDQQKRLDKFMATIDERGTPKHPFTTADDLRSTVFTMLKWMFRRGSDQQAYPPPIGDDDNSTYIAHPYILMDKDQSSVRLNSRKQALDSWHADANSSPCLLLCALGGMGKSALNWAWMSHVRKNAKRPPRIMWWSFYAHNAGPAQFAKHLLWWLSEQPGVADEFIARDDLPGLYNYLLRLLGRQSSKLLLCLDGIERALVAYRDLKSDIAPDEGLALEITLRDESVRLAKLYNISEEQAHRYLLKFADRPMFMTEAEDSAAVAKRIGSETDSSHFADFLRQLLSGSEGYIKVFATSRFVPTVFAELSQTRSSDTSEPLVTIQHLGGLDATEAKELWESIKGPSGSTLKWEDEPCPDEIGGGTLAEICCTSLGGYALPITTLGELVAADETAGGRFSVWKAQLRGFLRAESWVRRTGQTDDEQLSAMNRLQAKLLLLTFNQIKASAGDWDLLSTIIIKSKAGCSFSDLYFQCVGPDKHFQTPDQLFDALNRLRRWKIVGRSPIGDLYDTHPVVRRGMQEYDPDNDESVQKAEDDLLTKWSQEDAQTTKDGHDISLTTLNDRWTDVLEFLKLGALRTAFNLFTTGVDYWLRYRTRTGNVVAQRAEWIRSAGESLQPFIRLKQQETTNLRIFEGMLLCCDVDNWLLVGDVNKADEKLTEIESFLNRFEQNRKREEEEASDTIRYRPGDLLYLKALSSLLRAFIQDDRCLRLAALHSYFQAIRTARDAFEWYLLNDGHADKANRSSGRVQRIEQWALFRFTVVWAQSQDQEKLQQLLRCFPTGNSDADAALAEYEVAVAQGKFSELAALVQKYVQSCTQAHDELNYGIASAKLLQCTACLRGWLTLPPEDFTHLLGETEEIAEAQGYQGILDVLRIRRLEYLWHHRLLRDNDAANLFLEHATTLQQKGNTAIEAECRMFAATALFKSSKVEEAKREATKAFTLAAGDGGAWTEHSLQDRIAKLCVQMNIDLNESLASLKHEEQAPLVNVDSISPAETTANPISALPDGITNTKGWTETQILDLLESEKRKYLDWDNATDSARKWWEAFQNDNQNRSALVLRLAQEIKIRKANIAQFYAAYIYSNTVNIQANLNYLDYTLAKNEQERLDKVAKRAGEVVSNDIVFPDDVAAMRSPGTKDPQELTDLAVQMRLEQLKEQLDFRNATDSAMSFWLNVEESQSDLRKLLWLAEELVVRTTTITAFFLAYVYANTTNVRALLHYLDYNVLKQEEQKKTKEAAERERVRKLEEQARLRLRVQAQLKTEATAGSGVLRVRTSPASKTKGALLLMSNRTIDDDQHSTWPIDIPLTYIDVLPDLLLATLEFMSNEPSVTWSQDPEDDLDTPLFSMVFQLAGTSGKASLVTEEPESSCAALLDAIRPHCDAQTFSACADALNQILNELVTVRQLHNEHSQDLDEDFDLFGDFEDDDGV